jgi:hypothetical protein
MSDEDAQLELIVRLGNLVDIVQQVFQSLDLAHGSSADYIDCSMM